MSLAVIVALTVGLTIFLSLQKTSNKIPYLILEKIQKKIHSRLSRYRMDQLWSFLEKSLSDEKICSRIFAGKPVSFPWNEEGIWLGEKAQSAEKIDLSPIPQNHLDSLKLLIAPVGQVVSPQILTTQIQFIKLTSLTFEDKLWQTLGQATEPKGVPYVLKIGLQMPNPNPAEPPLSSVHSYMIQMLVTSVDHTEQKFAGCAPGLRLLPSSGKTCPKGQYAKDGICCKSSTNFNSGGICCAEGEINTGGICCLENQVNLGGKCCNSDQIALGHCCPTGTTNLFGTCCPPKTHNSAGMCCPLESEKAGGICCPRGLRNVRGQCVPYY